MTEFLFNGPDAAPLTLVLAHGAGGPMDSPFMETIAGGLAGSGIRVARFEFPYMRRRRETGSRSAPDSEPVLMQSWRDAIAQLGGGRALVIGGKSLGGRIASMIADEAEARGLVCLGYPFHPPGKSERLRVRHLGQLRTPALLIQGTRDPFGRPEEVGKYKLSVAIQIEWLEDGDHSFKPRPRSGRSAAANLGTAIARVAEFVKALRPA
ncbi:MAG TPA: alpha/beta family hydrolase [Candidatus Binataceae bacterium]|jgi:predicted alpha/beta-hydrolase family hydrolase|nr:alpha/beta family hydrolase [Candidatus Binataceae bacterium]